jgi:predicted Zn-dependent protease
MSGEPYSDGGPARAWMFRAGVGVLVAVVGVVLYWVTHREEGKTMALSQEQEKQLGAQAFNQVLSQSRILRDQPVVQQVKEVTERLERATANPRFLEATHIPQRHFDWSVAVVQSKEVNAFCLPGGKMVVYTGILPVCKTEAGLATVMGHEISHALARHGSQRMAQEHMAQIAMGGASVSLSDMSPAQRQQVLAALNAGARFGLLMPYGRKHESEADKLGLFLMATAGFDPREAVKFWMRMQKMSANRTPEFMSTHPSHETRIRDLEKLMPEALKLYKADPDLSDQPLKWPPR